MSATTAALVGAFGGALIGFFGAVIVDRVQGERVLRAERKRAFASFLGALYAAIGEFREMPRNRDGGLFERLDSFLTTEQAAWVQSRRSVAKTSPQLFTRIDRLLASLALLQTLDVPTDVMGTIEETIDYAEQLGQKRTDELKDRWPEVRKRLLAAGNRL